jgi:magnesium chelatase family protein
MVTTVSREAQVGCAQPETTRVVAARVAVARQAQRERWSATSWRLNSNVPGHVLRRGRWRLSRSSTSGIDRAIDTGTLTVRGYDRVLRTAWTLADLRGLATPGRPEVEAAFSLRQLGSVAA